MIFKYYIQSVYGNDNMYPGCKAAKMFLAALGLKTFTASALRAAEACGVKFQLIHKHEIEI